MTEQFAMQLFFAKERVEKGDAERPRLWSSLDDGDRASYRARAEAIMMGDVRRNDMSSAELEFWFGRTRVELGSPPRSLQSIAGKDGKVIPLHWWDTLEFTPSSRRDGGAPSMSNRVALFGQCNLGRHALTNLQVGGQAVNPLIFNSMHVSASPDSDLARPLEEALDNATVTLSVGDHPKADAIALDLWQSPKAIDVHVPARQSYCVVIDFVGREFFGLVDRVLWRASDPKVSPFRMRVHLEGWRITDDR